MSRKNQEIENELAKLALAVVKQSMEEGIDLSMRLDALKIGTQYLVGVFRANAKKTDTEEQTPLFDRAKAVLKAVEGGKQ